MNLKHLLVEIRFAIASVLEIIQTFTSIIPVFQRQLVFAWTLGLQQ